MASQGMELELRSLEQQLATAKSIVTRLLKVIDHQVEKEGCTGSLWMVAQSAPYAAAREIVSQVQG